MELRRQPLQDLMSADTGWVLASAQTNSTVANNKAQSRNMVQDGVSAHSQKTELRCFGRILKRTKISSRWPVYLFRKNVRKIFLGHRPWQVHRSSWVNCNQSAKTQFRICDLEAATKIETHPSTRERLRCHQSRTSKSASSYRPVLVVERLFMFDISISANKRC